MTLPESFGKVVGELPVGGRLPDGQEFPFGTLRPVRDGFVERNDVKSSYAECACAPAARELQRRPFRFIRGPHARGARHARARGDARAGALPAGGDGWCGARCETHRSGPGKPMVGAVLVPHR